MIFSWWIHIITYGLETPSLWYYFVIYLFKYFLKQCAVYYICGWNSVDVFLVNCSHHSRPIKWGEIAQNCIKIFHSFTLWAIVYFLVLMLFSIVVFLDMKCKCFQTDHSNIQHLMSFLCMCFLEIWTMRISAMR